MQVTARMKLGTAMALVAATVGATAVDTAFAHRQTIQTRIRFVPSQAPDTAGQYELRVTSRNATCYRRVPVQVIQNRRIVYAARTTASGIAPSLHTGGPRLFGPEFAGSRGVVRTRTFRRTKGHVHRCGGASTAFPTPSG
jgi:hypothetical protein